MKQLTLVSVMINNFRSFHQESVQLSTCEGLKLFSGQNLVESRLGANGVGKTSFWDAIFWCWYGTSIKGLRTSSLVQWSQKTAEVLTELNINNISHTIYRSGPPVKIEIDEKAATQDEVDKLIGLTGDQFTHSIIFGQGIPLFPDLPIPERGALLDSVLNLDIWQKAAESATKKVSELEKKLSEKKMWLARVEGQLSQLATDESIELAISLWNRDRDEEITSIKESISKWNDERDESINLLNKQASEWKEQKLAELEKQASEIDLLERELATTEDLIKEIPLIDTKQAEKDVRETEVELRKIQKDHIEIQSDLKHILKPKDFWLQNNNCPTCLQPINEDEKQKHLSEIETKEQELTDLLTTLSDKIESAKVKLEEKKTALTTLQHLKVENNVLEGKYRSDSKRIQNEIKRIEDLSEAGIKEIESGNNTYLTQIERLEHETNPHSLRLNALLKQKNPYIDTLANNKQVRQLLENDKTNTTKETQQINDTIICTDYWKNGFKRIRLYFIQQILGALEIEIQSAISALGLEGWRVKLSTESETKSGTTKLGVQIHIRSPLDVESSWDVWSGGETQRLRLSIAMGLSSLIQRAKGSWFNFMVFDEPTTWLSSEGIEDLLVCLTNYSIYNKKSIWLIDHRSLESSSFSEVWNVVKTSKGSTIEHIL